MRPGSPLKSSDLLVYSYLSARDRFGGRPPSNRAVARATMLAPKTVGAALARLVELGFVAGGRPRHQPDHFFSKPAGDEDHWSARMPFWKSLVPAEDGPLGTNDVMVFSFLVHLYLFEKKASVSGTYVGNAVGLDGRTVSACLDRLADLQLYRTDGTDWLVPKHLTGQQVMWFLPKLDAPKGGSGLAALGEFEPDPALIKLPAAGRAARQDGHITSTDQPPDNGFREYMVERLGTMYTSSEYLPYLAAYEKSGVRPPEADWPSHFIQVATAIESRTATAASPGGGA